MKIPGFLYVRRDGSNAPAMVVNGLILGSVYALPGLVIYVVYGIIKLINFAHGDIYMVGAFMDISY